MIADTGTPVVVLTLLTGVARSLGRLGVAVYGVKRRDSPHARSTYVRELLPWDVDRATPEATAEFLLSAARRIEGRPLLLAADDPSSMVVADHADALAEAYTFPRPPAGLARALYAKHGMYELCRRHDVPTPVTALLTSSADARRFADDNGFPVVLKADDAAQMVRAGGARTVIAGDRETLLAAYERLADPRRPNLIAQEYIPGGPDSIWMFDGYFDARSECRFSAIGRKLRQYPPATGPTSLGVCRHNAEVDALTRRFMRDVGYAGVLDCGWRWDVRDGRYKLLDVNPRIGATFRLFVGTGGLDVVRALYLDLTGQPVPADHAPDGRRWQAEDFDVMTLVRQRRTLSGREWLRSLRGIDERAWLAADDPLPFLAMSARLARRGVAVSAGAALRARTTMRIAMLALVGAGAVGAALEVTGTDGDRGGGQVRCDRVASPAGRHHVPGTLSGARRLVAVLRPGQTGCLRGGSYRTDLTIARGRLVLRSLPGQRAVLVGRLWVTRRAHDVVISDLALDGRNGRRLPSPTVNGARIAFVRDDVTNRHTAICFNLGSRRYGRARGTVIRDSRIHDCGRLPPTNREHGIYVAAADRTRIVGNVIAGNADRAIQLYPDAQHTVIARNVITGNGEGILFSGAEGIASSDTLVHHNLIADSRVRANVESYYPPGTRPGTRNVVRDNCLAGGSPLGTAHLGFTAIANEYAGPGPAAASAAAEGACRRTLQGIRLPPH